MHRFIHQTQTGRQISLTARIPNNGEVEQCFVHWNCKLAMPEDLEEEKEFLTAAMETASRIAGRPIKIRLLDQKRGGGK